MHSPIKFIVVGVVLAILLIFGGYVVWAYPPHPPGGMGHGSGPPIPTATLTGIALSNRSFVAPAADGTVVGAITVQGSGSIAAAQLSITGADGPSGNNRFRLSNATVPSNLLVNGTQNAGSYSINLVATLPGATGSPFTQSETVTGAAMTITSVSISCGGSCAFTPGQAGTIGTASATVSSGSPTGTWSLKTSGTDHAGATCGPATNLSITSGGVLSNNSSAAAGTYAVCLQYTQASAGNSPYAQVVTVTGTSLAAGFFVAANGTNNGTCSISQPCSFAAAQTAMRNSSTKLTYVRAGTYNSANNPPVSCVGGLTCTLLLSSADAGETWSYYPPDGVDTAFLDGGSTHVCNCGEVEAFNISATGVTIRGLKIWNYQGPIIDDGGGTIVEDNDIGFVTTDNCCSVANWWGHEGSILRHNIIHDSTQMLAWAKGTNAIMSYNYLTKCCGDFGDTGGLYTYQSPSSSTPNQFLYNYTHDVCGWTSGLTAGSAVCFPVYLDGYSDSNHGHGNIANGLFGSCWFFESQGGRGNDNIAYGDICDENTMPQGHQYTVRTTDSSSTNSSYTQSILVGKTSSTGVGGIDCAGGCQFLNFSSNMYWNYGTDGIDVAQDPSSTHANPKFLTCPGGGVDSWSYKLDPTSPALSSPINMTQPNNDRGIAWGMPGFWGPIGFTIPHIGTAPSYGPTC